MVLCKNFQVKLSPNNLKEILSGPYFVTLWGQDGLRKLANGVIKLTNNAINRQMEMLRIIN